MTKKSNKNKAWSRTKKLTATQYLVTYAHGGVMVGLTASCQDPQCGGTGNDWKVEIQTINSDPEKDDLMEFFEAHEMLDILRYDMQDWCRENLSIDWEEYEREGDRERKEQADHHYNSYTW